MCESLPLKPGCFRMMADATNRMSKFLLRKQFENFQIHFSPLFKIMEMRNSTSSVDNYFFLKLNQPLEVK